MRKLTELERKIVCKREEKIFYWVAFPNFAIAPLTVVLVPFPYGLFIAAGLAVYSNYIISKIITVFYVADNS